jgi:hypothetical protein
MRPSPAVSLTLDPLEMLARLCQHIPPPGLHFTLMYGAHANRTPGARAPRAAEAGQGPAAVDGEPDSFTPSQHERRRKWARLIAGVFEVSPGSRPAPTRRRLAERRATCTTEPPSSHVPSSGVLRTAVDIRT